MILWCCQDSLIFHAQHLNKWEEDCLLTEQSLWIFFYFRSNFVCLNEAIFRNPGNNLRQNENCSFFIFCNLWSLYRCSVPVDKYCLWHSCHKCLNIFIKIDPKFEKKNIKVTKSPKSAAKKPKNYSNKNFITKCSVAEHIRPFSAETFSTFSTSNVWFT